MHANNPKTVAFYVDGEETSFPPSAEVIFERRQEAATLLQVTVGNMHLNCHFFCQDEIEFDLDPRELQSEEDLDALAGFMSILANETGKPAILTHENTQEVVILTVPPWFQLAALRGTPNVRHRRIPPHRWARRG